MQPPSLELTASRLHWLANYLVSRPLSDRELAQIAESVVAVAGQIRPPEQRPSAAVIPLRPRAPFRLVTDTERVS